MISHRLSGAGSMFDSLHPTFVFINDILPEINSDLALLGPYHVIDVVPSTALLSIISLLNVTVTILLMTFLFSSDFRL